MSPLDDDAVGRLVAPNLALVTELAGTYAGRGVPLLDLVQAGNLGLIRAAEKFDPDRGYAFPPFASFYIRQAIVHLFPERKQP